MVSSQLTGIFRPKETAQVQFLTPRFPLRAPTHGNSKATSKGWLFLFNHSKGVILMQLTPHFSLAELTVTSSGLPNIPSDIEVERLRQLAERLEWIRDVLDQPMIISSAFRSELVNRAAGGADNSAHKLGFAADFTAPKFGTPLQVCMAIIESGTRFDQLINEYKRRKDGTIDNWVHFGLGAKCRQQVMTRLLDGRYVPGIHGEHGASANE